MDTHKRVSRISRVLKVLRGLCRDCPNPAIPGKILCAKCRNKRNENSKKYMRKIRERYIIEHRCTRCGAPLEADEKRTCFNCRHKATKYKHGGIYAAC